MPHLRDGHIERMNEAVRQASLLKEGLNQVEEEIKQHKNSKVSDIQLVCSSKELPSACMSFSASSF